LDSYKTYSDELGSALKDEDERVFVRLIVQGNEAAFEQLYELYKDKIFAFAFALSKSKDVAQEIVQETFVRLWEKRDQINPDISFNGYIKKITYHLVIDFFRKVKLDVKLQQKLQENMQELQHTFEDDLIGKDLNKLYQQAIDQLPTQKQKIYLLSRQQQFSYEEIAAELNLSKNTVRNHMTEAIKFIRSYVSLHAELSLVAVLIYIHRHFF
jgi:RNA polymerase sigma-70 factor (family 1)